jgi:type I restriction enzyme S subunit
LLAEAVAPRAPVRRFRPYPAYKGSGVEWLEEIPAHWDVKRLKRLGFIRYGLGEPPEQLPEGLPFIRATNIVRGRVTARDMQFVDPEDVPWERDPILRTGDIIVVRSGAYTGDSAIIPREYDGPIAGYDMIVRPRSHSAGRFLSWTLLSRYVLEAQIELASLRAAQPHLNAEELGALLILCPPASEQQAIAAFLDRETARIDALVAKKEALIALLQEKRTALITRAVTKGLDLTAPMKASNVDWLDEIPSHWKALPLKRWVATKITDGPHETPELVADGVDFISAEAVSNGRVDFERRRGFITPSLHSYYCHKCRPVRDDILICKSGATTGKLARVVVDFEFSIWSPLAVVRPHRSRALPRFLEMALGSGYVQEQIRRTWSAGTQPNISMGDLEQLFVIAPNLDEQTEILDYIDHEVGSFDALIAHVQEAIDRIKEFRTALDLRRGDRQDRREGRSRMSPEVSERSFEEAIEAGHCKAASAPMAAPLRGSARRKRRPGATRRRAAI